MGTIFEKFDSRDTVETLETPEASSVELLYGVTDMVEDDNEDTNVRLLVEGTISDTFRNMAFESYRIVPRGCGIWDVTVRYSRKKNPQTFSFDTTGGRQKITQS